MNGEKMRDLALGRRAGEEIYESSRPRRSERRRAMNSIKNRARLAGKEKTRKWIKDFLSAESAISYLFLRVPCFAAPKARVFYHFVDNRLERRGRG
uniref:Uncharacterized protein n=1 Tax=Ascaris lumbricoides TaxID=6252 RepID=A0A0M3HPW6_ASCLU